MTREIMLSEGVLNNDTIEYISDEVVKLEYFTYATEWGNQRHIEYFPSLERAINYYRRNMGNRVMLQGKYWLEQDKEYLGRDIYTPEQYWLSMVYEMAHL